MRKHRLVILGALISSVLLVLPILPAIFIALLPAEISAQPPYSYSTVQVDSGTEKIYETKGNRLYIPQIGVDTEIVEGMNIDVLAKQEGVWRDPTTSTPGKPGNMVLAGHRFQFLPPNTNTFYHLDKLKLGQTVSIFWLGKQYGYEIYQIFEVNPDEVWIKDPKEKIDELTLYTCTPIFTSAKRLIIKAKKAL